MSYHQPFTTGQEPDPCAYNDYWEVADRLSHTSHDAAAISDLLIQKCRNVCIIVYGSGNPDITGIEVRSSPSFISLSIDCSLVSHISQAMICYHIQGILVFLAGPVLRNLLVLRGRDSFRSVMRFPPSSNDPLGRVFALAELTHTTSILLAVPIAVATTVRISDWRNIPVTELKLLRDLVRYEYLVCLVSIAYLTMTPPRSIRRRIMLALLGGLLALFHAGLEVTTSAVTGGVGEAADVVNGLLRSCARRHAFPDLQITFRPSGRWIPARTWAELFVKSWLPFTYSRVLSAVFETEVSGEAAAEHKVTSVLPTWLCFAIARLSAALNVPIYLPVWDPEAGLTVIDPRERFYLLRDQTLFPVRVLQKVYFGR